MDDVIRLLSEATTKDEYGIDRKTYTAREVFAKIASITRAEFFDAGRNGLNPEYRMTIFHGDYNGESLIEYQGSSYAIYRVYRTDDDYVELYVERKGGTNGKTDST